MADIWSKQQRSAVMALVRSQGNRSTELRLVLLLRKAKITGWRRNSKLPGKPDFVFPRHRLVIFVDGDFWHGNPATYKLPKSNIDFWQKKVMYNRKNDRRATRIWRKKGWIVLRVWESALRRRPHIVLKRISRHIAQGDPNE